MKKNQLKNYAIPFKEGAPDRAALWWGCARTGGSATRPTLSPSLTAGRNYFFLVEIFVFNFIDEKH
jgi:hypothetical protein